MIVIVRYKRNPPKKETKRKIKEYEEKENTRNPNHVEIFKFRSIVKLNEDDCVVTRDLKLVRARII